MPGLLAIRHPAPLPPRVGSRYSARLFAEAKRNPLRLYAHAWKTHGDLVRFESFGRRWYLAVHPEAVRHVLLSRAENYVKPPRLMNVLRHALGEGIFTTDGPVWRPLRRWAQSGFGPESRLTWEVAAAKAADELLAGWRSQSPAAVIDVHREMQALALKTTCYSLFGTDSRCQFRVMIEAMEEVLADVAYRLGHPLGWPVWVPTHRNRRVREAKRVLDEGVGALLDGSRSAAGSLSAWTDVPLPAGDAGLRRLLTTLLVAATQSMGAALTWAWLLLARHPDAADGLIWGRAPAQLPAAQAATALSNARLIFAETLRLYPTGWVKPRQAVTDDVLMGYAVPRGTVVVLSQYLTHRHPAYWPDPAAFAPDRFAGGQVGDDSRPAFLPFGMGAHFCLGSQMAMAQGPRLLAAVGRYYRPVPLLDAMPDPAGLSFFLAPGGPVRATLHPLPASV